MAFQLKSKTNRLNRGCATANHQLKSKTAVTPSACKPCPDRVAASHDHTKGSPRRAPSAATATLRMGRQRAGRPTSPGRSQATRGVDAAAEVAVLHVCYDHIVQKSRAPPGSLEYSHEFRQEFLLQNHHAFAPEDHHHFAFQIRSAFAWECRHPALNHCQLSLLSALW